MLVFITGATSGIGKSTAQIFAKHGYDLVITGRRQERLTELKQQLEQAHGISVTDLCFDIRVFGEVEKAIGSLPEEKKKIDRIRIINRILFVFIADHRKEINVAL